MTTMRAHESTLRIALTAAANEHGCPNVFSLLDLSAEYGAPAPSIQGRIGVCWRPRTPIYRNGHQVCTATYHNRQWHLA